MTLQRYDVIVFHKYSLEASIWRLYPKEQTVYLDPSLHQVLRIKSIETSRSMSELINEALKKSLAEGLEDLAAFDERAGESLVSYEQMIKRLKKEDRI